MKIVIFDYGMGNLRSVVKKVFQTGHDAIVSNEENIIKSADKLILPGVGHFRKAVENLNKFHLVNILNEAVQIKHTPILGICLGMQLMASHSEEGDASGLNWFDAEVVELKVSDQLRYKVPHMGWNNANIEKDSPLFKGIPPEAMFYFVHSYHMICKDKNDILTATEYDYSFTSAIQKNNIFGTQFHPEKSHGAGEKLLRNFLDL